MQPKDQRTAYTHFASVQYNVTAPILLKNDNITSLENSIENPPNDLFSVEIHYTHTHDNTARPMYTSYLTHRTENHCDARHLSPYLTFIITTDKVGH